MDNGYFKALIPLAAFGFNALSQILLFRTFRKLGLLNSVFLGFICGFFVLCGLDYYVIDLFSDRPNGSIASFFVYLLTYVSFSYCYFHFINLGETARRIRILRELYEAPIGLSLDEILACYNAKEIISRRVSRLIQTHQIVLKGGRYYIGKPFVLWMARGLVALKSLLLGKNSEFD